jgi:hypothetical protein
VVGSLALAFGRFASRASFLARSPNVGCQGVDRK